MSAHTAAQRITALQWLAQHRPHIRDAYWRARPEELQGAVIELSLLLAAIHQRAADMMGDTAPWKREEEFEAIGEWCFNNFDDASDYGYWSAFRSLLKKDFGCQCGFPARKSRNGGRSGSPQRR